MGYDPATGPETTRLNFAKKLDWLTFHVRCVTNFGLQSRAGGRCQEGEVPCAATPGSFREVVVFDVAGRGESRKIRLSSYCQRLTECLCRNGDT